VSGRRIGGLFRRVVQEIRRDHRSLGLLFIVPLLVTGLFTFILREGQTPTLDLVIVNEAGLPGSVISSALTTALADQDATVTQVADEIAARSIVRDDSSRIAIVLPAGLGTGNATTITVITNGLDPSGEGSRVSALRASLLSAVTAGFGTTLPTIEHDTVYGTPSDDPMATFAPAMVAFFVYFFVYLLTGVSFLRERTGGTLERLMATPVSRGEIVVGYTLGFGLFAVAQVAVIMCWVLGSVEVPALGPLPAFSLGLGVPVAGSPLIAYLVVVLLAMGAVSLGIFFSTFARTELQIIQFIPIVLVPQILLCGVLFPVSSLPPVVQPLTPLLPLTYAVNGLRQVFIAAADLGVRELQVDLLVLAGFALFFAAIAALTIRRDGV